jgi:hypothetical protein
MNSTSTLWASKSRKWWINFFLGGDFDGLFMYDPEFIHLPKCDRKQAAGLAVNSSWSRWRFWRALLFLTGATVGLSVVDSTLHLSDVNETLGAGLGFLVGLYSLRWAIYQCGLPVYREALARFKIAEKAMANQTT